MQITQMWNVEMDTDIISFDSENAIKLFMALPQKNCVNNTNHCSKIAQLCVFNVCFLFYQKRYKKTQSKFILLQVTCISLSHILWMNDCRLMYAKHDGKQPAEWYMHTAENEINCAYHYIIITPLKKPLEVISFCLICFN